MTPQQGITLPASQPAFHNGPGSAQAVPQPLSPLREWTGAEATALRKALWMTESRFARSLSVSLRTVSNWVSRPATVPRSAAQDMLDELLAAASPGVRARFEQLTMQQSAGSAASGVPAEMNAWVVNLGSHPRYAADFRALACGQVSAARAALGMTPDEFAAWLGTVLGWAPVTGGSVVERWEDGTGVPPGDVVMAARAYLAGAR